MSNIRHLTIVILCTLALGCAGSQLTAAAPHEEPQLTSQQLLEVASELERRGDVQRTEQYLTAALERGASEEQILPKLLTVYVRDRQYQLAAQRAQDYLRRHPSCVPMQLLLAALSSAVGDYTRAAQNYRAVVEREPARADTHFELASVLVAQDQDHATADAHFRRYLELAPHGVYAERARAALLTEVTQ